MSQWEALLKLNGQSQENLLGLYNEDFLPVVVRQYLAPWIESQDWKLAARDRSLACVQFQNLLEYLDMQYCRFTEVEIVHKHNFRKFKFSVQEKYQEEPQRLAELIRDILQQERQILLEVQEMESQNEQPVQVPVGQAQQYEIELRINKIKECIQSVDQEVKFLEEQQEMFHFRYKMFQMESPANQPPKTFQKKKDDLQTQLNDLDRKRREILDQIKELLGLCETLLGFLLQEFTEWLQRQKLACIGASTDTSLGKMESWVTSTVGVFFLLRHHLCVLAELSTQVSYEGDPLKTDLQTLQNKLNEMLCTLLHKSFVVDKQPMMPYPCKRALVLKTSIQFSVRARFLVNLPGLGCTMKVVSKIDKNLPDIKGYRRFNLLGTQEKTLENVQRDGLVVDYKHLTVREQKARVGGKSGKGINDGSLCVLEELHNITFTTQFNYEGLNLNLEAVTLPFVIISNNVTQFTGAWASVLWFNLLSTDPQDLTFFCHPPVAPWTLLANALSWQFSCCTKRDLNHDQLQMLGKKLCGAVPTRDSVVTWSKFSKESMPKVQFTFWVWFDAIVGLVKAHLEDIWNDGYVMGFVSRSVEDSLLKTMQQGTFLLRFSESTRDGGITCSWVDHQDGTSTIRSVVPYTKKELSYIPLTEIIRNYQLLAEENIPENPLSYLYPNIPKDEAFGKYYEQRSDVSLEYQKYMKRRLIIVSKRTDDDSDISIASGTPSYFPETPQYDPGTPQNDPVMGLSHIIASGTPSYFSETPQYSPGTPQNDPEMGLSHIMNDLDSLLINPSSDPVMPNLPMDSHDLQLEYLHSYQ
ncbi:signal transducer and activator of transcription 2-like [Hyperolius riggenbachi]|uniref:signal transducer and activator of transcription 2-like n=1 Tax=Hyperolius riggenbachi TaxID=752182 RepID=UPI0035A379F4